MNVHQAIYEMLTRGAWLAPHEVNLELRLRGIPCAAEATTARMRDLRKPRYGHYKVRKQRRAGETYYEYKVILPEEIQKAA